MKLHFGVGVVVLEDMSSMVDVWWWDCVVRGVELELERES